MTVIIPSLEGGVLLDRCLAALAAQTLPSNQFEVVVVLDGSHDGRFKRLCGTNPPFGLVVIRQSQRGPSAARNTGTRAASGKYVLFIDDDVLLEPGAVEAHLREQERTGGSLVVGRISTKATHRGFPLYWVRFWEELHRTLSNASGPTFAQCFSGNLSVPLQVVRAIGGFSTNLERLEDVGFAYQAALAGTRMSYAEDAHGRQEFRKDTLQCLTDARREGAAAVLLFREHPVVVQQLPLGLVSTLNPAARLLVRQLVAVPLPTRVLALLGVLPERLPGTRAVYRVMHGYCYLRGAKTAATAEEWRRLASRRTG